MGLKIIGSKFQIGHHISDFGNIVRIDTGDADSSEFFIYFGNTRENFIRVALSKIDAEAFINAYMNYGNESVPIAVEVKTN